MKTLLLVSAFLFLSLQSRAQVVFTWSGTGNPSLSACSDTVKTSCISGFTLTDITTSSAPVVISSAIAESATTYTLSPLPAVGSHTWSLVVNGFDQSGNAIASSPATVTATVPAITLNPPTGFQVTP
jgi:hypothetical protein